MNATEALKTGNLSIRLSTTGRWLYWDDERLVWVVLEHTYGSRKQKVLYEGDSEDKAIRVLLDIE